MYVLLLVCFCCCVVCVWLVFCLTISVSCVLCCCYTCVCVVCVCCALLCIYIVVFVVSAACLFGVLDFVSCTVFAYKVHVVLAYMCSVCCDLLLLLLCV